MNNSRVLRSSFIFSLIIMLLLSGCGSPSLPKSYDEGMSKWLKNLSSNEAVLEYGTNLTLSGNTMENLSLDLSDGFEGLSMQAKYDFLMDHVWSNYYDTREAYLKYFHKMPDSKYESMRWVTVIGKTSGTIYTVTDGRIQDNKGNDYSLDVWTGDIVSQKDIDAEREAKAKERRKYPPKKGMAFIELDDTLWGKPTSVIKSQDYDKKKPGWRYEEYRWEVRDSDGNIIKIRSAIVQEGIVLSAHEYTYTVPTKQ